jgi:hypothetical protein
MSYAAIIVGGGTLIYGAIEEGEAKKKARQLASTRPKELPSPETGQELALNASELSNSRNPAMSVGADGEFSEALDALLKGGGDANSVSKLFTSDEQGRQRQALVREQIRLQKVNNYVSSLREKGGEREQEFGFNEWAPWADAAQADAQAKQYGTNLEFQGLNTLGSGVASLSNSMSTEKMLDKYFGQTRQPPAPTGPVTSASAASYYARQPSPDLNTSPASGTWNTPVFTPPNNNADDVFLPNTMGE